MNLINEFPRWFDLFNGILLYPEHNLRHFYECFGFEKNQTILEVGCGAGRHTERLQRHVDVIAIDVSEKFVRHGRKKKRIKNGIIASVFNLPFRPREFHRVIMQNCFHHLLSLKYFAEIHQVIRPNGSFIIIESVRAEPGELPGLIKGISRIYDGDIMFLTKSSFKKLLNAAARKYGFTVEQIFKLYWPCIFQNVGKYRFFAVRLERINR